MWRSIAAHEAFFVVYFGCVAFLSKLMQSQLNIQEHLDCIRYEHVNWDNNVSGKSAANKTPYRQAHTLSTHIHTNLIIIGNKIIKSDFNCNIKNVKQPKI